MHTHALHTQTYTNTWNTRAHYAHTHAHRKPSPPQVVQLRVSAELRGCHHAVVAAVVTATSEQNCCNWRSGWRIAPRCMPAPLRRPGACCFKLSLTCFRRAFGRAQRRRQKTLVATADGWASEKQDAAGKPLRLPPAQPCPGSLPARLLPQNSPRLLCAGKLGRIDVDRRREV